LSSGKWPSSLRNDLTMEQVFSRTTSRTGDSRRGGKFRVVRLWLSILRIRPLAVKPNGTNVILCSFHWYFIIITIIIKAQRLLWCSYCFIILYTITSNITNAAIHAVCNPMCCGQFLCQFHFFIICYFSMYLYLRPLVLHTACNLSNGCCHNMIK